jgi:hypothetical protein
MNSMRENLLAAACVVLVLLPAGLGVYLHDQDVQRHAPARMSEDAYPDPAPHEHCAWRAVEPLSAATPTVGALDVGASTGPGDARIDPARAAWVLPPGSGVVLRLSRAEGEVTRAVRVHIEDAPGGPVRASLALWRGGVPEVLASVETAGDGYYRAPEVRGAARGSRVSGAVPLALALVVERAPGSTGAGVLYGADALVCAEASR